MSQGSSDPVRRDSSHDSWRKPSYHKLSFKEAFTAICNYGGCLHSELKAYHRKFGTELAIRLLAEKETNIVLIRRATSQAIYLPVMLDSCYPHEPAKIAVEKWNDLLSTRDAPLVALGIAQSATDFDVENVVVKRLNGSRYAKLLVPKDDGGLEEAVLTVRGVLTKKDLPPVAKKDMNKAKAQWARQHVSLIAYDSPSIQKTVDTIRALGYKMHVGLPDAKVAQPNINSRQRLGVELELNCRYYTTGRSTLESHKTEFAEFVDPQGVLASFVTDSVSHCQDNQVAYMDFKCGKYELKDPSAFQVGDIVEVGFAMVAWRNSKANEDLSYVTTMVLRSVTLLDDTYTKQAFLNRLNSKHSAQDDTDHYSIGMAVRIGTKRARAKDHTEESAPRKQFEQMNVSEPGEL